MCVFAIFLGPEVPYYVSVEAVNSLGSGDAQSIIAFTREGCKLTCFYPHRMIQHAVVKYIKVYS